MRVHKKVPTEAATSEIGTMEINQAQNTTGFETCQDIKTIKEELASLKDSIDSFTALALKETNTNVSRNYHDSAQRRAIRYWAIRWVMGWEKEIPNAD